MRELTRRCPAGSGLGAAWHAGGTGRSAEWLQRVQGGLEWCKRRPGRQKGQIMEGPAGQGEESGFYVKSAGDTLKGSYKIT